MIRSVEIPRQAAPASRWEPEEGIPARKRLRMWELENSVHCAVIGTCLSVEDLRRFARRMALERVAAASEFELHTYFVGSMHVANPLSRVVDKHLGTLADGVFRRLEAATTAEARQELWDGLMAAGRVGPAFWAFMTWTAVPEEMKRRVYGEIHMMSHLHGHAVHLVRRNAAALERRVQELEERNARDRRGHLDALRDRDEEVARLRGAALQRGGALAVAAGEGGEAAPQRDRSRDARRITALRAMVAAKDETLARQGQDIAALKKRLADLARSLPLREAAGFDAVAGDEAAGAFPSSATEGAETGEGGAAGRVRRIGYVGGRNGIVVRLKALAAEREIELHHHDGGLEDGFHRLECLVTGADCLMCPIDCISHAACRVVKELCRKQDKPFVPLRNSSVSCFERALSDHVGASR